MLLACAPSAARAVDLSAEFAVTQPATIESLATESNPDVACTDTQCLSVWAGAGSRLLAARVGAAGELLDSPAVQLAPTGPYSAVAWTGTSYLVVWSTNEAGSYVVRARFVSEAGAAGPVIDVASATSSIREVAVATLGGTALVTWRASEPGEGASDVRGARISADGSVMDPLGITIGVGNGFQFDPAVAASGSQFLVTWSDGRAGSLDIYGARVTSGGVPLDGGGVPLSNATGEQTNSSVAGHGGSFMVAWTDTRSADPDVYVARVASDMSVLDPVGVGISTNLGIEEAGGITHNGASYLLTWDLQVNDGAFGSVAVASLSNEAVPTKTIPVQNTGPGANTPRIAARGTGSAIVWLDKSSGTAVRLLRLAADRTPVDAEPVTVSNGVENQERPAVSYDGTNYLVAWFDRRTAGSTGTVRAARVAPNGTMLDPGGIAIATDVELPTGSAATRRLRVAWNGSAHLVVWYSAGDIRGVRVGANGTVLDGTPIPIAVSPSAETDPALAGSPSGWLVTWTRAGTTTDVMGALVSSAGAITLGDIAIAASEFGSEARSAATFGGGDFHVAYYFPASGLVRMNRVATNGLVFTAVQLKSSGGPPVIAAGPDHLLTGWLLPGGVVWGKATSFAGASLGSEAILGLAAPMMPEVVNLGGGWAVASAQTSAVELRHFTSDVVIQAVDTYPAIEEPALVAGPAATVGLAYSRAVSEAPHLGARRAFLRTLRRFSVRPSTVVGSATEGQTVQFKVTLSPARQDMTVTVDFEVRGSSATAGSDFPAMSGTLSFPPGTTEQFVTVPLTDDSVDEEDSESLFLALTGATGADLDDEFGQRTSTLATITDNDPSPSVSAADVVVDEDSGTADVTLQLSAAGQRTARVFLTGWGGTASPDDYTFPPFSEEVEFAPGETEKTYQVPLTADTTDEPQEYFDLRLGGAQALTISDEFVRVTINDDDPVPAMSVADVSVVEGDSLTTPAQVTISLTNPSSQSITAKVSTSNGTATAPGDYSAVSGATVTFNPGQTVRTTTVTLVADTADELNEKFSVSLSEPVNATLSDASADVTIVDDDGPALTVADASTPEGNSGTAPLTFQVNLSGPTGEEVTGTCATSNATASAGADYAARSAGFSIPAGMTATSFTVDVAGDGLDEVDETLTLTCTASSAADLSDGVATGTIQDDDASPVVSVSAPSDVLEGDAALHSIDLAVRLSTASGRTVTAKLGTADGSAAAPGDYTTLSGVTVTFATGETEKLVPLMIVGDTSDEIDETLTAALSEVAGAELPVPGTTVTILDDDGPTVAVADASATEGNAGTTPLAFQVNLSATSLQPVIGTCATADGSATAGADYTARSAPFSVPAGQTQGTFAVDVLGDTADEPDETVALTCTVDSSGELGDGQALGTITDDDEPVTALPTVDAPAVVIGGGTIKLDRRGRATVRLTCPASAGAPACTGRLTITTAAKVRVGSKRRTVVLGRSTFGIPRDRTVKVVVRLSKSNLKLVRRLRRVRVVVAAAQSRRTVQLRAR